MVGVGARTWEGSEGGRDTGWEEGTGEHEWMERRRKSGRKTGREGGRVGDVGVKKGEGARTREVGERQAGGGKLN